MMIKKEEMYMKLSDQEVVGLVREAYEVKLDDAGVVVILRSRSTGKVTVLVAGGRREVGLRCGREWSEEDLRRLGLVRPEAEWVRLLAPSEWAERAEWKSRYGKMDERTVQYLNAVLKNIGAIGGVGDFLDGSSSPVLKGEEVVERFRLGACGPEVEVGRHGDVWVVQRADVTLDDAGFTVVRFSRRPSRRDIETAFLVEGLYLDFLFGGFDPVFECWECGVWRHWLDVSPPDGSLAGRAAMLRERYCGC
jgi:hypothetical protein